MTGISKAGVASHRRTTLALACALCLALITLADAVPARAATSPPAAGSCGSYAYLGTFPQGPHLARLQGGASIQCSVPVGQQGTVAAGGGGSAVSHPDGTTCIQHQDVPITFNVNDNHYHATWVDPQTGQTLASDFEGVDGFQAIDRIYFVAPLLGNNFVTIPYERRGTYQANQCVPNQPAGDPNNHWIAQMRNSQYCGQTTDSQNSAMPVNVCIDLHQHIPTPGAPPGFGFNIIDIQGQLQRDIQGGGIHSAPRDQGVVNVPTLFWIEGATAVQPVTYVLYVPTPPDATGRLIVYQYILEVNPPTVQWHFGDGGSGPGSGVGGSYYAGGIPSAAHPYTTISQRGCHVSGGACDAGGTKYQVTADLNYTVNVRLAWFDGVAEHAGALPAGMQQLTVTVHPTPEDLFMGQVEGVPVA
jgi:hypothetical protein